MSGRSPLDSMQEWIERMNREFADATRRWEGDFGGMPIGPSSPDVDLVEHEDEYVVAVDLPGFSADDVTARVTDQTLYVDAEWSSSAEESEENFIRRERHHRSQSRSIRLPQPVDADAVEATMNNGVLTLTVPKATPASEGRQIDIS